MGVQIEVQLKNDANIREKQHFQRLKQQPLDATKKKSGTLRNEITRQYDNF